MSMIPFDPSQPDIEAVRQIVLERLRRDPQWRQLDYSGEGFAPFVEYVGRPDPRTLAFAAIEAFWSLVLDRILAPGTDSQNVNLPWFHLTAYGRRVLNAGPLQPYDPTSYLTRLKSRVPNSDPTVISYLHEALAALHHGLPVSCVLAVGIAAERVFDLVSESILAALRSTRERDRFGQLLERNPMKPKLDFVHNKLIAADRSTGLPENGPLMVTAIYDLLRLQRNDLGHPREIPPSPTREEAFVNLQIFPSFYTTAEELRATLRTTQI